MRLKITLAYDGTAYEGWQLQKRDNPGSTIQGAVEAALFALCGSRIRVYGAGRTDAGVHAHGQVAHFDVEDRPAYATRDWRKALNANLPRDIRVIEVARAKPDFHSRKDAVAKTYIYQFWLERAWIPPQLRLYAWACGALDIELVRGALGCLNGRHDFASFQNAGTEARTTVREILGMVFQAVTLPSVYPPLLYSLSITGTGFLKQMVRNIAGCLVYIGKRKLDAASLAQILASGDRRALPSPTAPATGLALAKVHYE